MIPEFKDPSDRAANDQRKATWLEEYEVAFDLCPVNKSFSMPKIKCKFKTLCATASRIGKNQNKKFKCVEHSDCYEIYRKK